MTLKSRRAKLMEAVNGKGNTDRREWIGEHFVYNHGRELRKDELQDVAKALDVSPEGTKREIRAAIRSECDPRRIGESGVGFDEYELLQLRREVE